MELDVTGVVFTWRGPAPHHVVALEQEQADLVRDVAAGVTYGWGMVPVTVRLGATTWTTSLWPQDGTDVVPLRLAARRAEGVAEHDPVTLRLTVDA